MKSDGCRRWWLRRGGPALEEIPSVSNASGTNVYVCWRSTYLSSLIISIIIIIIIIIIIVITTKIYIAHMPNGKINRQIESEAHNWIRGA